MKPRMALIGLLASIFLLLAVNANEIPPHNDFETEKDSILKLITPEEMTKILEQDTGAVEMNATRGEIKGRAGQPQARSHVTYTLGTGRVSGDRLVASETSVNSFTVPTTLTATIKYPSSGTGATVTYVEINVYQSNDKGHAYVTAGGIGSNRIAVAVEAVKTYYFDIYCYIYGK